jgi:hypothetical protein
MVAFEPVNTLKKRNIFLFIKERNPKTSEDVKRVFFALRERKNRMKGIGRCVVALVGAVVSLKHGILSCGETHRPQGLGPLYSFRGHLLFCRISNNTCPLLFLNVGWKLETIKLQVYSLLSFFLSFFNKSLVFIFLINFSIFDASCP